MVVNEMDPAHATLFTRIACTLHVIHKGIPSQADEKVLLPLRKGCTIPPSTH